MTDPPRIRRNGDYTTYVWPDGVEHVIDNTQRIKFPNYGRNIIELHAQAWREHDQKQKGKP